MSAILTVYSTSSPRGCAIAAGATTTLRDQARHHVSGRMIVLLEQQTRGNHRHRHWQTERSLGRTGGSKWKILAAIPGRAVRLTVWAADFTSFESASWRWACTRM